MSTLLNELLNASDKEAKIYALYLARNNDFIPSLIQYLSDENISESLRGNIARSLGKIGAPLAINKRLIKLYQESEKNSNTRFYVTYALAVYVLHNRYISHEGRHILLDALSCNNKKIREIATLSDCLPHHVENVYPLLKYLYLEYPDADENDWANGGSLEYGLNYFKFANEAEINKLEEIFLTANEKEIIALSIAVPSIRSKNMSTMIRKLLLKTKDKEIKIILIISLAWKPHRSSANIVLLESIKTQDLDIQKAIDYALKSLNE